MRRTRRSLAVRGAERRPDDDRAGRGVARRGWATCSRLALREQIGQVASSRLWRQNVGTAPEANGLLVADARLALLHHRVARSLGPVGVDEARVERRVRGQGRAELVHVQPLDAW